MVSVENTPYWNSQHHVETQSHSMNSEEFRKQIEQALNEDTKRRNEERGKIAEIMEHMPAIPFKDMEPLFRISFQWP